MDKKYLELACKDFLKEVISESKVLRRKLSFKEHKRVHDLVDKMNYDEVMAAIFNNGIPLAEQGESSVKRGAKYGAAAGAGMIVASKIKKSKLAPLVAKEKALRKAAAKMGKKKGAQTLAQAEKIAATIQKLKKVPAKKLGIAAGVLGLYLWRRFSDPCRALKGRTETARCRAAAIQKVISQLRSSLNQCSKAPDPIACRAKIMKEIGKWEGKYRQQMAIASGQA
jgi:hypothetical protein